jgi:hypothetical protein
MAFVKRILGGASLSRARTERSGSLARGRTGSVNCCRPWSLPRGRRGFESLMIGAATGFRQHSSERDDRLRVRLWRIRRVASLTEFRCNGRVRRALRSLGSRLKQALADAPAERRGPIAVAVPRPQGGACWLVRRNCTRSCIANSLMIIRVAAATEDSLIG